MYTYRLYSRTYVIRPPKIGILLNPTHFPAPISVGLGRFYCSYKLTVHEFIRLNLYKFKHTSWFPTNIFSFITTRESSPGPSTSNNNTM